MKKFTGDIIILDMCTKNHNHTMYGSWDAEWDRQILSFYTYICTIHEDHMIWNLKYKIQQTEILVILDHFLPFQPPDNLENQNFNIEKNTWRYYLTHLHHKWEWYMMYGSWDMEHDRQNFLSFWMFFALLPPMDPKNQIFEKIKKLPGHIILHRCTINNNLMMYGSSRYEIWWT